MGVPTSHSMPSEETPSLTLEDVTSAAARIRGLVKATPTLRSSVLDAMLGGHQLHFKAECFQTVGAFKARGAANTLAWLRSRGELPDSVVAYSSGNHAQAVAWAGRRFGVAARLFLPASISRVKLQATRSYGAEVVLCADRGEAEARAAEAVAAGAALVPPYDHDQVIAGQGTAALELLDEVGRCDALFAPCGGGGLLSGTVLAAQGRYPDTLVGGGEPLSANDAARSLRAGQIFRWPVAPETIADGARTLSISPRTMAYLARLFALFEIPEDEIVFWTQWLTHLLKVQIEPTAALGMAAAFRWLAGQSSPRKVGVILSGGNMDAETAAAIWARSYLDQPPSFERPLLAKTHG